MSNPIVRFVDRILAGGKAWWIEIQTDSPRCIYYFGPFNAEAEAEMARAGYIEDLEQEGAQHIKAAIKRCRAPQNLTIDDSEEETPGRLSAALSS